MLEESGSRAGTTLPDHEQHEMYRDWLGRPFDPRAFDLAATNRLLRQLGRWQA
ncbi:MAG TPA: hypothetical protein VMS76_14875 [Planctomycetota bacterium]|nr:hypothetical protein [Planctomycetota bacterium]